MASQGEEVLEYESDPEDVKRSLSMRRREAASDDEEVEGEVREEKPRMDHRAPIHSDESDGQGGAADYDEDEEDEYVKDEEEYIENEEGEEAYEEEEEEIINGEGEVEKGKERNEEKGSCAGAAVEGSANAAADVGMEKEVHGNVRMNVEDVAAEVPDRNNVEEDEEKKENEPFAVPTAGAFYMHDDRFRDNAGGRHRYGCFLCGLCLTGEEGNRRDGYVV